MITYRVGGGRNCAGDMRADFSFYAILHQGERQGRQWEIAPGRKSQLIIRGARRCGCAARAIYRPKPRLKTPPRVGRPPWVRVKISSQYVRQGSTRVSFLVVHDGVHTRKGRGRLRTRHRIDFGRAELRPNCRFFGRVGRVRANEVTRKCQNSRSYAGSGFSTAIRLDGLASKPKHPRLE